jgi:geranylgeranyl diphosphate synthase type II
MDITKSIHRINQALNDVPIGKQPKELYEPMEYMIQLDRQRHYPLLALWGSYLFAGTYEIALIPSIGVEVFHSFLMVHEDILDRNASRNNSLCVHEKWNNNVAILSGDAMIFKAYELLIQVEPRLVTTVIRKFNYCFTAAGCNYRRSQSTAIGSCWCSRKSIRNLVWSPELPNYNPTVDSSIH